MQSAGGTARKATTEFLALIAKGTALTNGFVKEAVDARHATDLDFRVDFIVSMITSFAERTTDERTSHDDPLRQADLRGDMLIDQFRISD